MNLLEMIKRVLSFQDWKEASSLPGWRSRPPRMRHTRTPFHGSRRHEIAPNQMTVEEFTDKDERNARFRELRAIDAKGKPHRRHVSKWSTVRTKGGSGEGENVWCVAYR